MCKIMEDMGNEAAQQAEQNKAKKMAIRMIKAGKMSLEDIADYTELSLDTIKELPFRNCVPIENEPINIHSECIKTYSSYFQHIEICSKI